MSNAAQKMIKARANLVMGNPFFGTLALRLKMVEDKTVKLSSTDGTVLRYNPDAVAEMPLSKVQGMLAHTVMHPAMLHHTRRGARDKAKWNKACDYSINTILSNAGFDLPEGKYINPAYAGMTAEQAPLWAYGEELYRASCGTCHNLPPPGHTLANQWSGTLNAMKRFISIDDEEYRFLLKYLQFNAKDTGGKDHG